eukprot:gnl/MRDRNA2_/MRDRNA2_86337_c0_seq1.p1 gnl/MRDRNA2_/MRDRNA2_86337_c0~~gnl/MRDRNA2_/MRDRNA2_86337_c0_seq1.p1  ORF type:complete len:339 (+),score=78.00 gnl/MRDRNA2_/MRDRNA2_86337_c0_seq1:83-1099(+)
MRGICMILMHALIAQAVAKDSMDQLMEQLADKLIDRVSNWANTADLDKATLAKTHQGHTKAAAIDLYQPVANRPATSGLAPLRYLQCTAMSSPVNCMQTALASYGMPSSPVQHLALTAISATRDVSMAAQVKQEFEGLDSQTRRKFKKAIVAAESTAPAFLKDMAGITAPMGLFDPVGWTTDVDNDSQLMFYREAELKHGRVGMIASLGIIVQDKFHPFFGGVIPSFSSLKDLGTFQQTNYETFWISTFLACGALELLATLNPNQPYEPFSAWRIKEGYEFGKGPVPGDLGYDPLGLKPKDPQEFKEMQNKELNNGRLAMLAAAGMIAQEMVTGKYMF